MTLIEFQSQVAALRPTLKGFTHRFTSDREESQDLVQDTIMKALIYAEKFKADTNLKGWLFTIMRNTFINNYRKAKNANVLRDTTKDLYYLTLADTHTFRNPESGFELKELWRCINEISDELLVPFKMHTTGYKYAEIAEKLRLPIGTIKNRIFHARKEIQKKMGR